MSEFTVRSLINERDNQEDSHLVIDLFGGRAEGPLRLLALSDGMGGHAGGEAFSEMALRKLAEGLFTLLVIERNLNKHRDEVGGVTLDRAQEVLCEVTLLTNRFVRRMMENAKIRKGGATLVCALIMGDEAVVLNLGDSPLYHRPEGGALVKKTEDHTLAESLRRKGMITDEMAEHHSGRNVLQYHFGAEHLPESDMPTRMVRLDAGDLLLLCSDGVSGDLSASELDAAMGSAEDLEGAADALIAMADAAGHTDNQTLILWRHGPSSASKTPPAEGRRSKTVAVFGPASVDGAGVMDSEEDEA